MDNRNTRLALIGGLCAAVWIGLGLWVTGPLHAAQSDSRPRVELARINGVIDPFTEGYIERVIGVARDDGAAAIVFQLDTPGGALDSTRQIVEAFFDSPVPIIVYIAPPGARAGSAGVFITYASHVAAMAPGTNIGAAHPVSVGSELTGTMDIKVTNDSAALIRTVAQQRGRNVQWGEDAVRESVSITEQEALDRGVINFIARDIDDVLNQAHGRTVKLKDREVTLNTRGATLRQLDMNFFEEFFHVLLDPNIALILLNVGSLAILIELYNPGTVLPAIIGIICLTLAAVALFGLPTNWAAVILIVAALIMFVLDIKVSGFALTVGGIAAFVLGAFFLFRPFTPPEPTAPAVEVSPLVIAGTTLLTASFFIFILGAAWRSRNVPVITGVGPYIGAEGVARTNLDPEGTALVRSEEWTAIAENPPIAKGENIRVVGVDGVRLRVVRRDGSAHRAA